MTTNRFYIIQMPIILSVAICLLVLAMIWFPGGTVFDYNASNYRFFENFLSHLGREATYSGIDNSFSKLLFTTSIYLISFSFVIYFLKLPFFFKSHLKSYRLTSISTCFVLISAIAFVGIGYFSIDPSTIFYHLLCVKLSFYLFFISSVLQTISISIHPLMNKKMLISYLIFSIFLLLYNLLIQFGPRPNIDYSSLVLQVTAQKIIALSFFLNFYIQSLTLNKILNKGG